MATVGLLEASRLQALLDALAADGYAVIGPTIRDGAIVHAEIERADQLPAGMGDSQDGGHYRLVPRDDGALFGYATAAQSWRPFLSRPRRRLWRAEPGPDGTAFAADDTDPPRYAFLGVRSCEIHAIAIQDRVFVDGPFADADYAARRAAALIVAVSCGTPAGTCFCASMDTGPRAAAGYDIALTELIDDGRHVFLVETGSDRGAAIVARLPLTPAAAGDADAADTVAETARRTMGRTLETDGLKALLQGNPEHPRWDDVAARCLSCANCTLVCPTCFCSTTEDTTDLTGTVAERHQRWDSCFTLDHSYLHGGGSVRAGTRARYRQWMTHKLAHWIDQFDVSGCVGCGRCITWCPVGIDITAEAAAIRADDRR